MNTTCKHTMSAVTVLLTGVVIAVSMAAPCRADNAVIGPESQIANVTGAAVDLRGQVSITAGAGSYLAVWRDRRSGSIYDIYGAFVDADGDPLGDESFLISCDAAGEPTSTSENHPSVAFNGTNFLVVWDAVSPVTFLSEIYGTRVTPSGVVLDPNGFEISLAYADIQSLPSVASNGTDWEVVWQKGGGSFIPDIAGATVAGATRSITKRISIATTSNVEVTPKIASNGLTGTASRYFVAWEDQGTDSDVRGCRINDVGDKVAGSDVVVSNRIGSPSSGATGAQFLPSVTGGKDSAGNLGGWMVAWEDAPVADSGAMSDVRVTRITAAGAVQDTGGILVFDDYGKYYPDWNYYYSTPEAGWNGLSYQVACRHGLSTKVAWGRTVGYNGTLGTATQLSTGGSSQNGMSIAGGLGGGGCLLAMEYSGSTNIGGCYVRQTGVSASEHILSLAKQDQQQCAAAWDGFRQVVVWADRRNGAQNSAIYAARIHPNGIVDDPQGVAVSPSAYEQTQPAIAWNPVNACYLVVWREGTDLVGNYDIKGMRLNTSLAPIGSQLTICSYDMDRANPAVAWNGSYFLVVWADNRPLDETWDIYGMRVSGTGVLQSTVYVTTSGGDQVAPSVVAGPSGNWLVAWQDYWAMKYEYAIGTSYGATNTRTWTTAATATEITATGLSLTVGLTYYISVRAINRAGTKSSIGCSDGIRVVAAPPAAADQTITTLSVPTTPVVTDDGDTTTIKTSLHATWTASYDYFGEPAIVSKVVTSAGSPGTEKSVSTTATGKAEPKVAFDSTNSKYLVVWSESATSIHGTLLSSASPPVPGSDIVVTSGTAIGQHPSLAWTGDKYVAVWEDRRGAATFKTDIYGTRIAADGTVQDTGGGVLVSNSTKAESGPIIVPVSSAQCLAYYTNMTCSINRLRARTFWTVTPPPPEYWINDAKQLSDGTPVTFAEAVVTAGNDQLSGKFYIEDKSRASGIKVVWSGSTVSEGALVTVSGAMATEGGERQLTATSVTILPVPGAMPAPFGIQPMSMGGVAAGLVPGWGTYGPNNIGLLVKCWGRVQNSAGGYFELQDPNGKVILVNCPFALPTNGTMCAVTGISSCEPVTGGYGSVLLVRKVGDIQNLQ